jgi:hypothetical protein
VASNGFWFMSFSAQIILDPTSEVRRRVGLSDLLMPAVILTAYASLGSPCSKLQTWR